MQMRSRKKPRRKVRLDRHSTTLVERKPSQLKPIRRGKTRSGKRVKRRNEQAGTGIRMRLHNDRLIGEEQTDRRSFAYGAQDLIRFEGSRPRSVSRNVAIQALVDAQRIATFGSRDILASSPVSRRRYGA